jgi:hypothetical protein
MECSHRNCFGGGAGRCAAYGLRSHIPHASCSSKTESERRFSYGAVPVGEKCHGGSSSCRLRRCSSCGEEVRCNLQHSIRVRIKVQPRACRCALALATRALTCPFSDERGPYIAFPTRDRIRRYLNTGDIENTGTSPSSITMREALKDVIEEHPKWKNRTISPSDLANVAASRHCARLIRSLHRFDGRP